MDPAIYPTLPDGPAATGDREWRHRRYDLDLVIRAIERHTRPIATVLDVGAWNGWLSARLAARGHELTGVDPFTDPYDGLGAHRHYRVRWTPVQLDVRDLTPLNTQYDLVVLNRCLAFAPDPIGLVRQAQARVAPGGLLVATGLQVFADPSAKARTISDRSSLFETRHGLPFFLWPTRGYLDTSDVSGFRAAGLRLRSYPWLRLHDLKARMRPTLPLHYHGHWIRP
jgi:SAM-dependent methyltransferase